MKLLLITLISTLAACASIEPQVPFNQALLTGDWGWSSEQCNDSPFTFKFSEDISKLETHHGEPSDPNFKIYKYEILKQAERTLTMLMDDEKRLTKSGKVVQWDLRVISADRFCWHRTDWSKSSCVRLTERCD